MPISAHTRCDEARLSLPGGEPLEIVPLLCGASTRPGGLELDVVDLGRGTPEEIRAAGPALQGRAALVRHDYMFGHETVHRRVKLAAAIEAGAAAFLIAVTEPGLGPVAGSVWLGENGSLIPALGLSAEAAARLTSVPNARIRLHVAARFRPDAATETLELDLPGRSPDRVVLCAHIDGHASGESALDNASGVAVALALARSVAPRMAEMPRGLTLCLFSAEEWALSGSKAWLAGLTDGARERLVLNLNLDTLVGGSRLAALTSGFPTLGAFAARAAASVGAEIGIHLPLMPNSDHANLVERGIPAMRLVPGFDEPASRVRLLLTQADRGTLVAPEELAGATRTAASLLWAALAASAAEIEALRDAL